MYPAGKPEQPYAHAPASADGLPSGDAAISVVLLGGINAVRTEAALPGVRSAEAQSRTATQLAPYYFASRYGGDSAVADKVALGLLAGWDVDGMVREGHFGAQWSYERDVAAFVEAAIASPFGREALLDPQAVQIALGPLVDKDNPGFGAVFGTYAMIDATGRTDNAAAVVARLTKLRGKISRPPPAAATPSRRGPGRRDDARASGPLAGGRAQPDVLEIGRGHPAWQRAGRVRDGQLGGQAGIPLRASERPRFRSASASRTTSRKAPRGPSWLSSS